MKLRNFMYATMIACAFASCSKDEVVEPGNGPEAGAGKLVISAKVGATTKAVEGTADENTTGTVDVFLYKGTQYITSGQITSDASGSGQTTFTELTVGDDYEVYVYANMTGVTSENANKPGSIIRAITDKIVANAIPMSGSVTGVSVTATGGVANVDLIRNVARIDLSKVSLGMAYRDKDTYTKGKASFTYKGVSINNALTKYAADHNPVAWVDGDAIWGGYAPKTNSFGIDNTVEKDFYRKVQTGLSPVNQEYDGETPATTVLKDAGMNTEIFYVVPNSSKSTIMLVEGSFSADIDKKAESDGWYKVVVGVDGTVTDENNNDAKSATIAANKWYDVQVIIAGPGAGPTGGDKPALIVNTKVKGWDKITQVAPVK